MKTEQFNLIPRWSFIYLWWEPCGFLEHYTLRLSVILPSLERRLIAFLLKVRCEDEYFSVISLLYVKLQSTVSLADSLEIVQILHSSLLYKWKQDYVSFIELVNIELANYKNILTLVLYEMSHKVRELTQKFLANII